MSDLDDLANVAASSRRPKKRANLTRDAAIPVWVWIGGAVLVVGIIAAILKDPTVGVDAPNKLPGAGQMHENVRAGSLAYWVSAAYWSSEISDGPYLKERPDGKFLVVLLSIKNGDDRGRFIPPMTLEDEAGRRYDSSAKGFILGDEWIGVLHNLNPDVQTTKAVVFDVPKTDHRYSLVVSGELGSRERNKIELSPTDPP